MGDSPRLWTPQECADYLSISTERLSRLRVNGTGPEFVKVGGRVRYVPGVVARWVKGGLVRTTKQSPTRHG